MSPAFVSAADIADRIGRSRQSIGLLARGQRGPGGFPTPVNPGGRSAHHYWPEVVAWLRNAGIPADVGDDEVTAAKVIIRANAHLHQHTA